MTDREVHSGKNPGARLLLATLLTTVVAFAEEPPDADAIEPAVQTSYTTRPPVADAETVPPSALATETAGSAPGRRVMDQLELGRTEIIGNQELPKVMYIVPWQKSAPGDLMGKPVNTLLDEVLAPLDREEFRRQVDYYGDLYGDAGE